MTTLSVLDLATVGEGSTPARALADTRALAQAAERLGYRRFWVAEHHAMDAVASSAPAVLLAHLAAATTRIRVGSGGVMLPNHAPLVVAEQFATLEALHPGRVDLGLGRAPGTDPLTARALRRAAALGHDTFPDDVVELIGYFNRDRTTHPTPTPGPGYAPEVWLLGSSTYSARLAAVLGLPFAFAYHFAPQRLDEALDAYRSGFRPSVSLDAPRVMVGVSVVCAESDDVARYLAGPSALQALLRSTGRAGRLPRPETAATYAYTPSERAFVREALASHVIGGPATVRAGLAQLVRRTGADELILSARLHAREHREASLELTASAWPDSSELRAASEPVASVGPSR
ncbi:MAG: alkanal monooxygenase [Actinobacteria bacterium 21-73-9]|nr:MAG: alkanal monooxygenase [Actinobacteria bacterium 21-73-9]